MSGLPRTWSIAKLSDIATVVTGTTPPKSRADFYGGEIPFVTPSELGSTEPVVSAKTTLSALGGKSSRILPAGSVMVCCIGSLGKVGIAGKPLVTNQQINSLICDDSIVDSRYVFHYCHTLKHELVDMAPATTIAIVNKSRFQELRIPLPPLPEQKRIADILDKADAIRRKRAHALELTDQFLQSVFLDMFGDPVTNPKGWDCAPLSNLVTFVSGGTPSKGNTSFWNGEIPWVSPKDMKRLLISGSEDHISDFALEKTTLQLLPKRSLLIVVRGMILVHTVPIALGTVPVTINQDIKGMLPRSDIDSVFLLGALLAQHNHILSRVSTAAHGTKRLEMREVESLTVPLPALELRKKYTLAWEKMSDIRARRTAEPDRYEELFSSLSQRAFRGEL